MENLIQYRYNLEEIFFQFDHGKTNNHVFIRSLKNLESKIRQDRKGEKGQELLIRFSEKSPDVFSIKYINDCMLKLEEDDPHRKEMMKNISSGYRLGNDMEIYFC